MIGLVLGETQLGRLIVSKLDILKIKYVIIDISKKKLFKKNKNSHSLSIGQLGKAISIFKKNKCKKVIFAGRVPRPNFTKTKFDFKSLFYLPKIIKSSKKGDSYIIKEIIKIFKRENIKIVKQTFYNSELVMQKGTLTKIKEDLISKNDIAIGKSVIHDLKDNNVGQAVVIRNNHVIAVEDQHGTDSMLNRANSVIKKFYKSKKKEGVLLKFPKSNQDNRIDIPTIGIKTLKKCAKIGLKGIVLKSQQNILLDKKKSITFANKNKMFITVK